MAGNIEKVGKSIVIRIEKAASPTHKVALLANTCEPGHVCECRIAVIVVQIYTFIRKICLYYIEPSVMIVVAGSDAHACLRPSVFTEGDTSHQAFFAEGSVVIVHEEKSGRRIAGHIDVRPAVIVEVCH